ncbi:hypothetical protein [Bacillus thuringiensis]|nr:hypothetical protein [Bacillus thuringiensis]
MGQVNKDKNYCSMPIVPEKDFKADVNLNRRELIREHEKNG